MWIETLTKIIALIATIVPVLIVLLRIYAVPLSKRWPSLETPIRATLDGAPNFLEMVKSIKEGRGLTPETLAPVMYRAYMSTGDLVGPIWADLSPEEKKAWIAAASLVSK